MRLLRQPLFLAVALGHFSVDVFSGQAGILLAVLSGQLGMSNAAVGLIATGYSVTIAVAQPAFGWLSDRYGGRWFAAGGVLWMAACFSLLAVTSGHWPIALLLAAALGSAAFHPPGAMTATQVGHLRMAGRAATAASIFFLFGQGGWSVGPAVGGIILEHFGRSGLLILSGMAAAVGLFMTQAMRLSSMPAPGRHQDDPDGVPAARPDMALFMLAVLLAGLPAWAQTATSTFAPKFYQEQGIPPTIYGTVVGLFMAGSAVGGVVGAMLSDRWGRRWTITPALALSLLPFYLLPLAKGGGMYGWALAAGLFSGAPQSILITVAQRSLPGRVALASGIAMGSMFAVGALGTFLSGLAADRFGLGLVLQANALVILCAAGLSLALRPEVKTPQAAAVSASVGD